MEQKFVEKTILLVPLDWGLGHTARCIPIIQQFQSYQFRVVVAADGAVKSMLKKEFPDLTILPLPGYNIRYSKSRRLFTFKILLQLPGIVVSVYKEQQWLKKVVAQHGIDAIISDNRFGLYHATIPSVYITHQLNIKTGNPFASYIASKLHSFFIKQYKYCWVPDFEGQLNAAGDLSHPVHRPNNVRYLGCISRFSKKPVERKYELIIVLSGPEPQRSMLETLLLQQLPAVEGDTLLVRGLPGATCTPETSLSQLTIVNHLPAVDLNEAMQQSAMVVCRSGYTSVMDLLKLRQKAILIPTPGQAEQEYLAAYLLQQQLFYTTSQANFNLPHALAAASKFDYQFPDMNWDQYKKVIQQFVETL